MTVSGLAAPDLVGAPPPSCGAALVSVMARDRDAQVEEFRTRPLDAGPYTFLAADALVLKVREGGRIVNVHALLATGVNTDGHKVILGLDVLAKPACASSRTTTPTPPSTRGCCPPRAHHGAPFDNCR